MIGEIKPVRRVVGLHDARLDGLTDLLSRCRGCSVMDIGCNKGHVAEEFYRAGARLVHGCDIYAPGIEVAKHWFAELNVQHQFEVVDLTQGPRSLDVFGTGGYDIMCFIGVYHKLVRVMSPSMLSALMQHLADRTLRYFAYNGMYEHLDRIDNDLGARGLKRIHTSELAFPGRPAAIWVR
jgi:2-polyprenyl-3-methyl-5-hydroxy-6-metoxy-1,4-benzoquinol methylase